MNMISSRFSLWAVRMVMALAQVRRIIGRVGCFVVRAILWVSIGMVLVRRMLGVRRWDCRFLAIERMMISSHSK